MVIVLYPVQLRQMVSVVLPGAALLQAVGIVVGGNSDHRIVGDSRLLQLLHQIGQGRFQFQVGRQIAFHRFRIGQIRHLVVIFLGHGVPVQGIDAVAADRHVVHTEMLLVQILGYRLHHHLPVAFRPHRLHLLQPAVKGQEPVIAQISVGFVPLIEIQAVVVISGAPVALLLKLVAHGQEEVLLCHLFHAGAAVDGHQAHHIGEFSGDGAGSPGRLIVVCKLDTLGGQTVQRGRQLRVDGFLAQGLRRNENQVFPGKQTGIIVLPGRGQAVHIGMDGGNMPVGLRFRQRSEVQPRNHLLGIFRFLRLFRRLRLGFLWLGDLRHGLDKLRLLAAPRSAAQFQHQAGM